MNLQDLDIYLICLEDELYKSFSNEFKNDENVKVFKDTFKNVMDNHTEIDTIVSPANSYGYMTGGFDAAISDYLGWDFQEKIQRIIEKHFYGEQPVGSSFITSTDIEGLSIIHTPSMRVPSIIKDYDVVYQCMRTTLMCALNFERKCILIPAFGAGCGDVPYDVVAKKMKEAYDQIKMKKGHASF